MTKQVKCVSPHGGGHHGIRPDGSPVHMLPVFGPDGDGNKILTGSYLPETDPAKLLLPPHEGGYVSDARFPGRHCAVGEVYDVDDDFYADGFHWSELDAAGNETGETVVPEPDPAPVPAIINTAAPSPAAGTAKGEGE